MQWMNTAKHLTMNATHNPYTTPRADKRDLYHRLLRRLRNSSLVLALDRIYPSIQLVVVLAPDFCTPLMTMQRWLDSMTTATPNGFKTSAMARATCFVSLSCTCSLRENISAKRASFESPITRRLGIYPICICKHRVSTPMVPPYHWDCALLR